MAEDRGASKFAGDAIDFNVSSALPRVASNLAGFPALRKTRKQTERNGVFRSAINAALLVNANDSSRGLVTPLLTQAY